jgi:hypothetical protein
MKKKLLILFLLFTITETYAQISKDDHNLSVDLITKAQLDLKEKN